MITKSSGFSLVELLVVVAIVGILSAVGTISYQGYVKSAKRSSAQNIVQQTALAQTEEYSNSGSYIVNEALADGATLEDLNDADCRAVGDFIDRAVAEVLKGDTLTYDLGGSAGTTDVGDAVVVQLEKMLREHFAVA